MDPKILVPVNDSPTARATVYSIISLKDRFPKTLTLLYVIRKDLLTYKMIPDIQMEMVKSKFFNLLILKILHKIQFLSTYLLKIMVDQ